MTVLQMKDKIVQSTLAATDVPPSFVLAGVANSCGKLVCERDRSADFTPMFRCCSKCSKVVQDVWLCNAMQHSEVKM